MGEVLQWKPEADASGREAELSSLLREHDEAKSSARPRFVFVRGPQGVGKSFLFSLLRRALVERGTAVFEGGSAREVKRTFGLIAPIARALTPYLEQTGVPQPKLSELTARTAGLHGECKAEGRLELFDAVSEAAPCDMSSELDAEPDLSDEALAAIVADWSAGVSA